MAQSEQSQRSASGGIRNGEFTEPHSDIAQAAQAALARGIERRQFLRKAANAVFYGFVAVSAGSVSFFTFLTDPAQAAGACCPPCCSPSPCCETSCCSKNCCDSPPNRHRCLDNAACNGYDYGEYSDDACWSCLQGVVLTTCCDCKTVDESGCSNPYATNRCICYQTGHFGPQSVDYGPKRASRNDRVPQEVGS
jgi:hypothetical protein